MGTTGIFWKSRGTFEEYVNCSEVISSKLCTIDEPIENAHTQSADERIEDDEKGDKVAPPSFQEAVSRVEKLRILS